MRESVAPAPDVGEPLGRNRNFTLLWVGGSVSALGSRASAMAFPLLVLAVGGSASEAGLVGAAAMAPNLVFQLVAGALVDRWNRRTVMIVTDVGRALAIGSVAWAALVSDPTVSHLAVAAFVEGTLTVFHVLAQRGAVRTVVPDRHLGPAFSRNEATSRAAFLAGQPLGGLLFAVGRWVPFLADLVTYVVSLVTVLLLRGDFLAGDRAGDGVPARRRSLRRDVWQGCTWLWNRPFLRTAALSISASNLMVQAAYLTVIVTITRQGGSSVLVGFVLAGAGVGGITGALAAPWVARRLTMPVLFVGVNWLWAVLIVVIALAGNPWVTAGSFALFAFTSATANVVIGAYQVRITPPHLLARVSGVIGMVSWGTVPVGSLLAGFLLDHYAGTTPLAVLGASMAVVAVAVTFSRAVRDVPDEDAEDDEDAAGPTDLEPESAKTPI